MNAKKILVVLPHPDDEVFPMSGTLSQMIRDGAHVTYGCLTLGEMGRNLGNPPFANRYTLPSVRKQELIKSCGVIGIQDLRMLGFHDKTIEFEPHEILDKVIMDLIEEVKPELIFTFYPGYGVHPDHDACGAAVVRTVGKIAPEKRPPVLCCAFPNQDIGTPDLINDVSDVIKQKLGALGAHSTQFNYSNNLLPKNPDDQAFLERIKTERLWYYKY